MKNENLIAKSEYVAMNINVDNPNSPEELSMEQRIGGALAKKMSDGSIERIVGEQFEKGVVKVMDDLFGYSGPVRKKLEEELKNVMVPFVEAFDFNEFLPKLDLVLTDLTKEVSGDYKKLINNFSMLSKREDLPETLTVTDLFTKWIKKVEKEVETDGLGINYDDRVTYESVEVEMEVDEQDKPDWSSINRAVIRFTCEHDESMNIEFPISRYDGSRKEGYDIDYKKTYDLSSLRYLNEFELYVIRLAQFGTKIILDEYNDSDEVTPEKEPEATFE